MEQIFTYTVTIQPIMYKFQKCAFLSSIYNLSLNYEQYACDC